MSKMQQGNSLSPPTTAGTLMMDGERGLAFMPEVTPSAQIKTLGFTHWDGVLWHQAYGHITPTIIPQLEAMFGPITVAPAVTAALAPRFTVLPAWLAEHERLFDYQKEAINYAIDHPHALIALAPGLGKTTVALHAAYTVGAERTLIIAPLSLLYNWRKEITLWLGEEAVFWYNKNLPIPGKWVITNFDTVRRMPGKFMKDWDAIIIDESVLLKNRKAQRTERVRSVVNAANPQYLWELSGSPTTRLNDDLWSQLNILNSKRFSSYWRFTDNTCWVERDQWGWHVTGNKIPPDQLQRDLSDIYFARSQDQVLDLPEWLFESRDIAMSPRQSKLYRQMEKEFLADLDDYGDEQLLAPNHLAQLTRLIQLASNPVLIGGTDTSPKWDAVKEALDFDEGPFIIWAQYIATAQALAESLSLRHEVALLTGSTPASERQEIVDAFQGGNLDIIVAHPAVGKYGLTLTAARTSLYVERNFDSDAYYQSLHRVRRIGTTHRPHIVHLLSVHPDGKPTVDRVIGQILKDRKDEAIALTTGEIRHLFASEEVRG